MIRILQGGFAASAGIKSCGSASAVGLALGSSDVGNALARCLEGASTSYAAGTADALPNMQARRYAQPAGRSGDRRGPPPRAATPDKDVTPVAAPAADAIKPPQRMGPRDPRVALKQMLDPRGPEAQPDSLLPEESAAALEELTSARAAAATDDDADGAVGTSHADGSSLRDMGVPLSPADVAELMHQSLSNAAGHAVHFRPFFFSNIFQSAPVVASYVAAALEAGNSWNRVERFFISSIEDDTAVMGIKVRISGRLGRKASMASIKEWEHGEHGVAEAYTHVDYGAASALTRVGVIGVKVWVRYHESAIPANAFTRKTGFSMPLCTLLGTVPAAAAAARAVPPPPPPRPPAPAASSAWWSRSALQQPAANRTWEALSGGGSGRSRLAVDPTERGADYLERRGEAAALRSMGPFQSVLTGRSAPVLVQGSDGHFAFHRRPVGHLAGDGSSSSSDSDSSSSDSGSSSSDDERR